MAFTPSDIKFKYMYNGITGWEGHDWIGGSIQYTTDHLYTGYEDTFIDIGNVKSIDISGDFDGVIHGIHSDRASQVFYPLVTWDNNVTFGVCVYEVEKTLDNVTKWCINVEGAMRFNNVFYYEMDLNPGNHFDGCRNLGTGGGSNWQLTSLAVQYGIKVFYVTDYATGQGTTVEGVTQPTSFAIRALPPFQSYIETSGFQSFASIGSNQLRRIYQKAGYNTDLLNNPQYFYWGYGTPTGPLPGGGDIFSINDVPAFINRLKNLGGALQHDPMPGKQADDPNQDIDPSGPGGGDGDMDPSSDPIDFPSLPTGGALASGAITAFKVTPAIMAAVFQKLWDTSIFDIATFQKLTDSPLDNLISLQCVPIAVTEGSTANIMLGNFNTTQAAHKVTQEYYTIDCGKLTVERYWGSALDQDPYTKVQIFLPFIGIKDLDTDDVMGKTIHVKYNYSIFDGNLTAQIKCNDAVLYKYPGNVRETIPVTARVNDALQRIATSAASLPVAAIGGAAGIASLAISTAVNVAMAKTHTTRSGELQGSTGLLDDFVPYLIIHRPLQSLAENFRTYKGYPSNITATLSSLNGYTEVEYIHLTGVDGATDTELNEIEALLKKGVII